MFGYSLTEVFFMFLLDKMQLSRQQPNQNLGPNFLYLFWKFIKIALSNIPQLVTKKLRLMKNQWKDFDFILHFIDNYEILTLS